MARAFEFAGLSDIGCRRAVNQDRWAADPDQGLFIVADGVAGSTDGALAAQFVVEALPGYLRMHLIGEDEPARLLRAVAELSDDLYDKGLADETFAGATSTVVAALVTGSHASLAHLGDSRAYLFREQQLHQLTRDHSLVQALIDAGEVTAEDAARHPARNVIIRFAAMPPPAVPDGTTVALQAGDRLLLCSDGLYGVVDDGTLVGILTTHPVPADACAALIEAARAGGGPDNITAVVVDIPIEAAGT